RSHRSTGSGIRGDFVSTTTSTWTIIRTTARQSAVLKQSTDACRRGGEAADESGEILGSGERGKRVDRAPGIEQDGESLVGVVAAAHGCGVEVEAARQRRRNPARRGRRAPGDDDIRQ